MSVIQKEKSKKNHDNWTFPMTHLAGKDNAIQ